MARKPKKDSETHLALLQAATHLFARGGESEVSISGVAHEAERARGTVYHHFRDRDALVRETKQYLIDALGEGTLADAPLNERIELVANFMWSAPHFVRSHAHDLINLGRNHPTFPRILERSKRYEAMGILRPGVDPELAAVIGLSVWVMASMAVQNTADEKERRRQAKRFVAAIRRMLFHGIYDPDREAEMRSPKPSSTG